MKEKKRYKESEQIKSRRKEQGYILPLPSAHLSARGAAGRRERGGQSKLRMGAGLSPSTPQHSDGAERTPTHVLKLL